MLNHVSSDSDRLTDEDVHEALAFLVAVEPEEEIGSREEYEAETAPYRSQIDAAMATLRRFAEQIEPLTLEAMQAQYYGFTNDPRYLTSAIVSSVVTGALSQAWDGVGPWRR